MAKVFVIDVARCSGCHNCQLACKDEHVGNDLDAYAKPQPEIGQFLAEKVQENVCGTIPKVKNSLYARHCNTAPNLPVWKPVPTALYIAGNKTD